MLNQKNDKTNRENLFKIASSYYNLYKGEELKKASLSILQRSKEEKDTLYQAKAFNFLGKYKSDLGQKDSAFYYFVKSEKLFKKAKDSLDLGYNYINKAFVQLYENDFSGCEFSSIQALNYLKNYGEKQKKYDAYNLIGISSNELKNYENSLLYHNKALYISEQNKLNPKFHLTANSLNNIGVVFQNIGKNNDAIKSFQKALTEKNLLNEYPVLYATLIDNFAYSKFKNHEFENLPYFFNKALKIRDSLNISSGIVASKIHLSEYYSYFKDTIKSTRYAYEALNLAKKTHVSGDVLGALNQVSLVDHKNAAIFSKEYIRINDSIQQVERKSQEKFARLQLETDEIIQEKDELQVKNRNLLLLFIGSSILFSLMYVIRHQRAKNRELLYKQAQQKANEDIYNLMISQQNKIDLERVKEKKRIAQDLHDGVLGRMFGTRLNLDTLNSRDDEEEKKSRLNFLSELKNIEQDIREISHDLNREKFVLINNFVAIVNNLLEEQSTSFPSKVVSTIDRKINWGDIANATKINLYRMLQESLQNVNKYASAKNIKVDIKKIEENIILSVADDGVGFIVTKKNKGIGLQNMISRTNECHGIFDIQSEKNKGTTITITIPTEIKTTPTHT